MITNDKTAMWEYLRSLNIKRCDKMLNPREMMRYLDSKGWNRTMDDREYFPTFLYWDPLTSDSHNLEEAYQIEKERENVD